MLLSYFEIYNLQSCCLCLRIYDKSLYEDTRDIGRILLDINLLRIIEISSIVAPEHPFVTCYQNCDLLVIINAGITTE